MNEWTWQRFAFQPLVVLSASPFLVTLGLGKSETHGMLTQSNKKYTDAAINKEISKTASMLFALLQIQGSCR